MGSTLALTFLAVIGMIVCLFITARPLWSSSLPPTLALPGKGGGSEDQLLRKGGGKKTGWRASTVWSDWLDRKRTLLFNLEDLAHEQRLGKLSVEDFARMQASYKKDLVQVMEQMEHSLPPADFEVFLTSAVHSTPYPPPLRGRVGWGDPEENAKACHTCQALYESSFSFCPKCGAALVSQS